MPTVIADSNALTAPPASGLVSGLEQRQIPIITGLRAVAVFLVILFHSEISWMPGGLGVSMFFVISGFLITWLLLNENSRTGTISLTGFYSRRSLRIFPAFYAYALVTIVLLSLAHKRIHVPSAIASVFYVENINQAWHGDPGTPFSHTWSLGVEEQFYVLWPLLFLAIRKQMALLIRVPIAIIGCVWIYRPVLKFGFHVWQGYFYEAFETRMDHLLIGCLLAILLFAARHHKAWDTFCGRPWILICTVALLIVSVIVESNYHDLYRDSLGFIVNPLLCALLIVQLISLRHSLWVRWLEWAPVRYLGSISYSLYLYQQLVLGPVRKLLHAAPFAIQLIISIAVLVVVASCSYRYIETPFLRLKQRIKPPKRETKPA